jgi:RNA polymerase sigma factor (sigma-70 family)
MNALQDSDRASSLPPASDRKTLGQDFPRPEFGARSLRRRRVPSQDGNWERRSERWGRLMAAAQNGERHVYDKLLRELDVWLRGYYRGRLSPPAADDARQDTLLAIHTNRFLYVQSGSFGAWVAGIARHKWIDRIRETSRFASGSLHDDIAVEDHGRAANSAISVDRLLSHLKSAQADVIRLVKLQGLSIEDASGITGQSAALVKVNVHRGLKKLSVLVSGSAPSTFKSIASRKVCRAENKAR